MRIIVCGGRNYRDWETMFSELDKRLAGLSVIIQGGANGADRLAKDWATNNCVEWLEYKAPWAEFGKRAGPLRNAMMLHDGKPDLVLAFPGGSGTSDMIRRAKAAGIPVHEVNESGSSLSTNHS